jgi:hypothetical protein
MAGGIAASPRLNPRVVLALKMLSKLLGEGAKQSILHKKNCGFYRYELEIKEKDGVNGLVSKRPGNPAYGESLVTFSDFLRGL